MHKFIFQKPSINEQEEEDEMNAKVPPSNDNYKKFLKTPSLIDINSSEKESDFQDVKRSKKLRKRKLNPKDSQTPIPNKLPNRNRGPINFSMLGDTAAADFATEHDEQADDESEKMDIDEPEQDSFQPPSSKTKGETPKTKIFKPSKENKYLDLFITKIPVDKQEQAQYSKALNKVICDGSSSLKIDRKIVYGFYKTKHANTVRIKTNSIEDHVLLQKIFALDENKNPLGGQSKCELPHYLFSEDGDRITHKKKKEDPMWLVLKGVDRNFTRHELKSELTSETHHPITLIRLKNASGHFLSTVKVLFPSEEASEILKKGSVEVGDMTVQVEKCENIPSANILQCYKCQLIGHSAKVCKNHVRCPRCAGSHSANECEIALNDFPKYKCALCQKYGHGSSFSRCPKRQENISKLRDKKMGPRIEAPPCINDTTIFPPLDPSALPPPQTHPLQFPALKAVIEGLVGGIIQVSQQKEKPLTTATVIKCLSDSLQRHCNTRIDLNQETYQARLVATNPIIPSTLPINIGILPKQIPVPVKPKNAANVTNFEQTQTNSDQI